LHVMAVGLRMQGCQNSGSHINLPGRQSQFSEGDISSLFTAFTSYFNADQDFKLCPYCTGHSEFSMTPRQRFDAGENAMIKVVSLG
jgi:hypothetical protein